MMGEVMTEPAGKEKGKEGGKKRRRDLIKQELLQLQLLRFT